MQVLNLSIDFVLINIGFLKFLIIYFCTLRIHISEDEILNEVSSDTDPDIVPARLKKRVFLYSQKNENAGASAFLNALNDSATTVISDPGPNKKKSFLKSSFLSDEDSFRRISKPSLLASNKIDEETNKFSPLKMRKLRPKIFTKIRSREAESTENIFNNVLENTSSSSEPSIIAVNKIHHESKTINEVSSFQNVNQIEPISNLNLSGSKKETFKEIEQSRDKDQSCNFNLSQIQRMTRSRSKIADISIKSPPIVQISPLKEQKGNTTFENSLSEIDVQKKRPGFFKRTGKSVSVNAFENIFTSEDDSTLEVVKLNMSLNKNVSPKTVKSTEVQEQKQGKVNLSTSPNKSGVTPVVKLNDPGKKRKLSEHTSVSEIDVEYKNDETTKNSKEASVRSSSYRTRKSSRGLKAGNTSKENIFDNIATASVDLSKHDSSKIENNQDKEKLNNTGSKGIDQNVNQNSSLDASKKNNSSLLKSIDSLQNMDNKSQRSRLNTSRNIFSKQSTSIETSILYGEPQYESTRKINIPKFKTGKAESLNQSKSKYITKSLDEEDESDIDVSSSEVDNNSNNSPNMSNLIERQRELKLDVSESKTITNESSKRSLERVVSDKNRSNKAESVASERSNTISLSEGESKGSEPQSAYSSTNINSEPPDEIKEKSSNKRYTRRTLQSSSSDEETLKESKTLTKRKLSQLETSKSLNRSKQLKTEEPTTPDKNTSPKKQAAKPTITGYEILKSNNFDLKKLKEGKLISQNKNTHENNLSTEENNLNVSRTLSVEEEFRRIHESEALEIPSTSAGVSNRSRNIFLEDSDNRKLKKGMSIESPKSKLQRVLEDDDDSEVSESPLLRYSGTVGEEKSNEISPEKNSEIEHSSPEKTVDQGRRQRIIDNFFKPREKNKPDVNSQMFSTSKGIPFSQIARDKEKLAEAKKKIELMKAQWKKDLFKPKEKELPKRDPFVPIKSSVKKQTKSKPVDPAYLMNGVVYKTPKLPRPKPWATDRLYRYIMKKIEPKFKIDTKRQAEKFVVRLAEVVTIVMKRSVYNNYKDELESLMKYMAKIRLIVHRKDFYDFCNEYLPYSFREKATPILLPKNKISIPYDPDTLYTPLI